MFNSLLEKVGESFAENITEDIPTKNLCILAGVAGIVGIAWVTGRMIGAISSE